MGMFTLEYRKQWCHISTLKTKPHFLQFMWSLIRETGACICLPIELTMSTCFCEFPLSVFFPSLFLLLSLYLWNQWSWCTGLTGKGRNSVEDLHITFPNHSLPQKRVEISALVAFKLFPEYEIGVSLRNSLVCLEPVFTLRFFVLFVFFAFKEEHYSLLCWNKLFLNPC